METACCSISRAQLGGGRAVGEGDLVLQGQALRPAARGLDGRGVLQQEDLSRPRRRGARQPSTRRRFLDLVKKGAREEHDADGARRRRPPVPRRPPHARGAAEEARHAGVRQPAQGQAPGATRAWSKRCVVRTWVEAGLLPTTFTSAQARRGAHLLPHQPRRRHVPERQLVHLARVQPAGQGRPAEGLPARHHEVPDRAGRGVQRVPDDRGRRKLRRERRHQASEGGDRVPELVRYARDGQPLARERARADGHQGRLRRRSRAARRLFQELAATSQGAKYYFGRRSRSCRASRRRSSRRCSTTRSRPALSASTTRSSK